MEYRHLIQSKHATLWKRSFSNELGRLAKGIPPFVKNGTNTIEFIKHSSIPTNKRITYGRIVVVEKPYKEELFRTRLTVGGDKLQYTGETSTPTADLTTIKIFFNHVLSTPNAKFLTCDIINFYLNTTMQSKEYFKLPFHIIPQDIIDHYNLTQLQHNNFVYIQVNKGMYGLSQAGILAHNKLVNILTPFGYYKDTQTTGLWKNTHHNLAFTLVVDDFGIFFTNDQEATHLINILKNNYNITIDWTGKRYCGFHLNWDYIKLTVILSMPGYIDNALSKFNHIKSVKPQH